MVACLRCRRWMVNQGEAIYRKPDHRATGAAGVKHDGRTKGEPDGHRLVPPTHADKACTATTVRKR
jgi:hypothetical protein